MVNFKVFKKNKKQREDEDLVTDSITKVPEEAEGGIESAPGTFQL